MAYEATNMDGTPLSVPEEKTIADLTQIDESKNENWKIGKYDDERIRRREAEEKIRELQSRIDQGASKREVTGDSQDILAEYPDVDPNFIAMLDRRMEKRAEEIAASKIRPFEEQNEHARIEGIFRVNFDSAMSRLPEYKDVVNPSVIKSMSLMAENSHKTFTQIIEDAYGNVLTGRRTIETTTPGGGKDPETLDYQKAKSDTDYFVKIMENPKLKAEYNLQLAKDRNR